MVSRVQDRLVTAGKAPRGRDCLGRAWLGMTTQRRHGKSCIGKPRLGGPWSEAAGLGNAGKAWHGQVAIGEFWRGTASQARH